MWVYKNDVQNESQDFTVCYFEDDICYYVIITLQNYITLAYHVQFVLLAFVYISLKVE